jgi:hypothetical protein
MDPGRAFHRAPRQAHGGHARNRYLRLLALDRLSVGARPGTAHNKELFLLGQQLAWGYSKVFWRSSSLEWMQTDAWMQKF